MSVCFEASSSGLHFIFEKSISEGDSREQCNRESTHHCQACRLSSMHARNDLSQAVAARLGLSPTSWNILLIVVSGSNLIITDQLYFSPVTAKLVRKQRNLCDARQVCQIRQSHSSQQWKRWNVSQMIHEFERAIKVQAFQRGEMFPFKTQQDF